MKISKIIKYFIRYCFYRPITSSAYRRSLINILKYKFKYENKRYLSFYDSLAAHHGFSSLIINKYIDNEKIVIFAGEENHPAFKIDNDNLIVIYLDNKYKMLFLLLHIPIMITFSSGFCKEFKPKSMHLIHLFHSIVSMTHTYSNGSFDAYDSIFMVGPHHKEELEYISNIRNWKEKNFIPVGYPKIESLVNPEDYNIRKNENEIVVLFAPSWGKNNVLKSNGIEIIKDVLELGYKIIVRPHPLSFKNDIAIISKIETIVEQNSNCTLEDSNFSSMDSYLKSNIMISDWSGAAYEYSFGLLKPVLFIDGPMKIGNISEIERKNLPMEFVCREKIGKVTKMSEFKNSLNSIIKEKDWKNKIEKVRKDYLYNPGDSIDIAVKEINNIRNKLK